MMGDDSVDRTLWCGNLPDKVTEELLFELFLQAGPLESVRIPVDNNTGRKKNFSFIKFRHVKSVPYSIDLMNGIRLHGRSLRLQTRPNSIHQQKNNQNNSLMGPPATPPGGQFHRSMSAPNMGAVRQQWQHQGSGTPSGSDSPDPHHQPSFRSPGMTRADSHPVRSSPFTPEDRDREEKRGRFNRSGSSNDNRRDNRSFNDSRRGGESENDRGRSLDDRDRARSFDERDRDRSPVHDHRGNRSFDERNSRKRPYDDRNERNRSLENQNQAMRVNRFDQGPSLRVSNFDRGPGGPNDMMQQQFMAMQQMQMMANPQLRFMQMQGHNSGAGMSPWQQGNRNNF